MRPLAGLLLLTVACASTICTGAARESQSRHRHSHRRRLRETLPLLPKAFITDPDARSPGQVFYNIYSLALGDGRNFTFAQPGYVASTGFTVNATLDGSVDPGQLQLYCAAGAAQAQNRSAPLPGLAAALGTTSYTSMSAVLDVSTNHTNPFSSGSMFRRTGLEGDGVSYTDEGVAYSDPITCVVQYGNATDVPSSNTTYLGVRLTLAVHYPQPELVPSEQAAVKTIFTQCCNSTDSCRAWKQVSRGSNGTNRASANFCSVPGQICHPNGTLAVLDTSALRLTCQFQYRQLAAFRDLASLTLDYCWPNSQSLSAQAARCFRSFGDNTSSLSPPRSSPATWVDLFATLGSLKNLESLSITADNAFNGSLLPDMLMPGQATICSLARAKLSYLKISDVDGQADYVMHSLNGTLPACLFDSRSQIRTISIASTNLTGFEKPWLPSQKLAKLSYIGNINTYGDIPEFFGGLTNLSVLHLEDNSFNGSVPASLGNLTALKELSLEYQALLGPLPDNLAASPKLRTLGFGFNNFAGSVPSSIGASESLRDVTLVAANLSGPLPYFSAASQLRTILASDNNISGPFPASLGRLRYLQELQLDNNQLTGTLPPASTGALQGLRILDLSNNNITGPLRASWAGLPRLRLLDLSYNNFTGSVPGSLFRAPVLEAALLQDNSLTGALPASQGGNQTGLARLNLAANLLSGSLPSTLCTLGALVTLNMSANSLTGNLPSCMGNMGNLTALDVSDNQLSGSISPAWAASVGQLSVFQAGSNNFSGALPTGFNSSTQNPGLRLLDLSNNSLSGSLPASYRDLRAMRELRLGDNYLSGTIPVEWNKLANPLITLDLSDNNLTGVIPANVSYQIPVLRLQNNWFQEVPRSWYGTADRPGFWFLTELQIQGNVLTGPFPDGLARPSSTRKRTLTYLDLSDNNLSGPLPQATNATAPFFRDLWYFNASFNNLSGPIPEAFSRALVFNASAGFNWAAGFLGRAEALAVARQFTFDVSNNSLSGDLPSFLAASRLPKYLNASSVQLKGNQFSCSSAQDKGYLNLTSCAQAAGSAQAQGSDAAGPGRAGLGKGAIAGIVVGVLAALALVGGVLAYALRRRRSMQGWQKEALDGQHIAPKQGPGVELAHSSALA